MNRIPKTPPTIEKLPNDIHRPLFSVMIPTYNCIDYITLCLESILAQDMGEELMQIELIDDASTDGDVEDLVNRIGKGRVQFFKHEQNVGSLRNFETCVNRANGEYVHILHGDDYILPGFYAEVKSLFDKHPHIGAAFTNAVHIDEENEVIWKMEQLLEEKGVLPNFLDRIAQQQLVLTPSIVVKRRVYEDLGAFCLVHYGEDWHMWIRIASKYEVGYSPKVLAHYRVHQTNISSEYFLSGRTIEDINAVIIDVQKYLPQADKKRLARGALKNFCNYFSLMSDRIYHDYGRPDVALMYVKKNIKMHMNKTTLKHYLKIRFKLLIGYKLPKNSNF